MKKILWCGGSHLGHAKKVIESNFAENTNSFYITAGPKNKRWSIQGGRYFVEGSVVGDNGAEPDKRLDLSDFDQIIFIGQWIQPLKYLPRFQPISTALKHAILRRDDLFINLPGGNFNEPIVLFPKIAKGKCILLCDPWNRNNALPIAFIEDFKQELICFCQKEDIRLMFQPQSTLDKNLSTLEIFSRSQSDKSHFNTDFWRLYLQSLAIF